MTVTRCRSSDNPHLYIPAALAPCLIGTSTTNSREVIGPFENSDKAHCCLFPNAHVAAKDTSE